jgi:hypothetical protein
MERSNLQIDPGRHHLHAIYVKAYYTLNACDLQPMRTDPIELGFDNDNPKSIRDGL